MFLHYLSCSSLIGNVIIALHLTCKNIYASVKQLNCFMIRLIPRRVLLTAWLVLYTLRDMIVL